MWTVIGKDSQVEDGLGHAFLILSRSDETTMVLQTGTEINELDKGQSGFITDGPTVFCGNIGIYLGISVQYFKNLDLFFSIFR